MGHLRIECQADRLIHLHHVISTVNRQEGEMVNPHLVDYRVSWKEWQQHALTPQGMRSVPEVYRQAVVA